jgi:hypothetical protein
MIATLALLLSSAAWTPPADNSNRYGAPAATCAKAFPLNRKLRASCAKIRQFGPNERVGDVCGAMASEAKAQGFVLDHGRYAIDGQVSECDFKATPHGK